MTPEQETVEHQTAEQRAEEQDRELTREFLLEEKLRTDILMDMAWEAQQELDAGKEQKQKPNTHKLGEPG